MERVGDQSEVARKRVEAARREFEALGSRAKNGADGLRAAGDASAHVAKQGGLAAHQLTNLTYQLNDIAVSLAGGQNPFLVLLQQGSQIAPIFGGIGNTLRALLTPLSLTVGGFGAVAGALAIGLVSAERTVRVYKDMEVALVATGRSAIGTGASMRGMVDEAARLPGVSREAAEQTVQAFARTRQIGGQLLGDLTRIVGDYARATGQEVPKAAEDLAKSFADPAAAAKRLHDQLGILSDSQIRAIEDLQQQGRQAEAQSRLYDALNERLKGLAAQGMTGIQQGAEAIGKAWDRMLHALGNTGPIQAAGNAIAKLLGAVADAATPESPAQKVERIRREIEQQIAFGNIGLARSRQAALNAAEIELAQTPESTAEEIRRRQAALDRPTDESARQAYLDAGTAAATGFLGLETQRRTLQNQIEALRAARDRAPDEAARSRYDIALGRAEMQLGVLRSPEGQAAYQLDVERRIAAAPLTERARLRAQIEAQEAAARSGADDPRAIGLLAYRRVAAQESTAFAQSMLPLRIQATGLAGVAAAYRTGGVAGGNLARIGLQADVQAASTPGFDRGAYIAANRAVEAGTFQANTEQRIAELGREAEAVERVAAAQAKGNAAVETAQRLNQVEQLKAQATAAGLAAGSVEDLAGRYDALLQRIEAANRAARNAAALQAKQDELELAQRELALVGETEEARGRALELLRVEQDLRRRGIDLQDEQAKKEMALAEEIGRTRGKIAEAKREQELWLEPLKNAIGGIQSSFAGLFKSIASGGVSSFRDFASAVKNVFIDLAAQIAALLVFRPVVSGILGSFGLDGLAQQMGFGGSGGGNSLLSGLGNIGSGPGSSLFSGVQNWFGGLDWPDFSLSSMFGGGATSAASMSSAAAMDAAVAGGLAIDSASGVGGMAAAGPGFWSGFGPWGIGGLAASFIGNAIGGRAGSAISGAGTGAALGAAIGSIIPGIGTVLGGLIGGAGGGLFGGLFGGKPSVGPNGTAGVLQEGDAGRLIGRVTSGDNGFTGGAVVGYSQQAAKALQELADKFGTSVTAAAVGGFAQGREGIRFGFNGEGYGITAGNDPVGEYVRAAIQRGALAGVNQVDESLIAAAVGGKLEEAFTAVQRQQVGAELQQAITAQQQIAQRYGAVRDGFRATIDSLRIDPNLSPLSHEQRLAEARGQFAALSARAQAGDFDAAGQLQSFGPAFIRELRSYYGPNQQFAGEFEQTLATFGRISDTFGTRADSASAAIDRMNDQLARIGEAGNDLLTQIRAELAAQRQDLNALLRQATGTR